MPKFNEIPQNITTIEQAKEYIINIALNKWLSLPWEKAGIDKSIVGEIFDAANKLILRNSGFNLPLNVLRENTPEEKALIDALPAEKKEKLGDTEYWFVLLSDLNQFYIELITDLLYAKAPELIATLTDKDDMKLVTMMLSVKDFKDANTRLARKLGMLPPNNPRLS